MKHLLIAIGIGVLTIGFSVFVLSNTDDSYETDVEIDRTISLQESYEGDNYTLTARNFDCDEYSAVLSEETVQGCVLEVDLKNTTRFEQILNLDGDKAFSENGTEYPSSDDLSREYIPDNGLASTIEVDESVSGGVFFEIPEGENIVEVHVYESSHSEPIVVEL